MNRIVRRGLLAAALGLMAIGIGGASIGRPRVAFALPPFDVQPLLPIHRVLVMSMDGMRPDALQMVAPPTTMALARRGAVAWRAQTVLPSATLPAHASMLTGLDVSEHGVNYNDRPAGCPLVAAPTFLTIANAAGYSTAIVSGKEKFCIFEQTPMTDYTFARAGDRSVADRTIELLRQRVEVIFAHFPNPDYFGHLKGWMSEQYMTNVYWTDSQVGRVLAELDALGLADDTLIILTSDHGGHEHLHGGDLPEDRSIPWMIAGPGVTAGLELNGPVSVADTAATVLWALGLPLPASSLGRPQTDAFNLTPAASAVMSS